MDQIPTQNTLQIFEIFHLTPQKNCKDQRKLTIITPRNSFQENPQKTSFTGGVWMLNVIACVTHTDVQIKAQNS